jgi:hypothetical protein
MRWLKRLQAAWPAPVNGRHLSDLQESRRADAAWSVAPPEPEWPSVAGEETMRSTLEAAAEAVPPVGQGAG